MTERGRDYMRTDATIEHQKALDAKLDSLYPFCSINDKVTFEKYRDGDLHFISFNPKPRQANAIIQIALEKASNETNGVTFSTHGAEHVVYQEALARLNASTKKGDIRKYFQPYFPNIKTSQGYRNFPAERFIIETPAFDRDVLRPLPHQFANELPKDRKAYFKSLRQACLDKGLPFAMIAAIYKGLEPTEVFEILSNKDFIRNLPKGAKHIHTQNLDHRNMITALSKTLVDITPTGRHPKRSSDAYNSAKEIIKQYQFFDPKMNDDKIYGSKLVKEKPFARAVFVGLTEVAQQEASPDFLDPVRSEYIFKHENEATSRLITAFLVFEK